MQVKDGRAKLRKKWKAGRQREYEKKTERGEKEGADVRVGGGGL